MNKFLFLVLIVLVSCDDNIHLQEKYPNGQPKMIVYKINNRGQNRVRTFTEKGVIKDEYYKKNGKIDSIYIQYDSLGNLRKVFDIGDKEDMTGWVRFYEDNKIIEKFQTIDAVRDGWHIIYRPNGDTGLINYRVNDTCYYVRQRVPPSKEWAEYRVPVIRALSKDTVLVGEEVKFIVDYPPLPSFLLNKDDVRLAVIISRDDYLLEHYDEIQRFGLDKDWLMAESASVAKYVLKLPGPALFICQLVKPLSDGTYACLGSSKKKFVVITKGSPYKK